MFKKPALIGAGLTFTLVTAPAIAQQSHQKTVGQGTVVEHAEIGKLEAYDGGQQLIVMGLPSHLRPRVHSDLQPMPVSRTYRFDEHTHVTGVDPAAAGSARGLSGQQGGLILVRYAFTDGRLYTPWILNIGEGDVREADGSIVRTDINRRQLVVRNEEGIPETVELHKHALIDGPHGISDLASLHGGQQVRVYYVRRGGKNIGYLVHRLA